MSPRFTIAGALILIVAHVAAAQSAGGGANRVSFDAGFGGMHERDASVSPLLYHGFGLTGSLGLAHETPRTRTQLDLSGMSNHLSPNRDNGLAASGKEDQLWMQLSHVRRVLKARGDRLALFAGVNVEASAFQAEHEFVGGSAENWRATVGVGAIAQFEYQTTPGRTLTYRIEMPVVSGVVHPYNTRVASNEMRWVGPGGYRALEQRVAYAGSLSDHVGFRWALALDLSNLTQNPAVLCQRELLTVGLIWWTRRAPP